MTFLYNDDFNFPELSAELVDGKGRFYTTPNGTKYPSVTTILGAGGDNSWLEAWRLRVGDAEVARISGQASRRGTAVHEIAEEYLKNNPQWTKGQMPANVASFKQIKPFIDKSLSEIYGLEIPMYSDTLRTAGRVDVVGIWDGQLSIIDFKTSKRKKYRADISNYFMQCGAYAYMFYEATGLFVPNMVILMMVDDSEPLIFQEKTGKHLKDFIELRNRVELEI